MEYNIRDYPGVNLTAAAVAANAINTDNTANTLNTATAAFEIDAINALLDDNQLHVDQFDASLQMSFLSVLYNNLMSAQRSIEVDEESKTLREDRKTAIKQFAEGMRTDGEAKQVEFINEVAQMSDKKDSNDMYERSLDIAVRIMHSEKVTVEEMQLLSNSFPQLLTAAHTVKQENPEGDSEQNLSRFINLLADQKGSE